MSTQPTIAFVGHHATYAINYAAKAVAQGRYRVHCFVKENISHGSGDHRSCYEELAKDPKIRVLEPSDATGEQLRYDHLFVVWSRGYHYSREDYANIERLMSQSRRVGALCHVWPVEPLQNLRGTLFYLRSYPRLALRTRSFGYEERPQFPNWHRAWSRGYLVGCGPHPRFFHDPEIEEYLYSSWSAATRRSIKINFIGTPSPDTRAERLAEVRRYFALNPRVEVVAEHEEVKNETDKIWVQLRTPRSDEMVPRPPRDYLQTLTDADFTLCIPGYTIWSTRPTEALLRGSIPILDEREADRFLDLPLVDGENCLLVRDENWLEAIDKALGIGEDKLVLMRQSIAKMRTSHLDLEVWSRRLRRKMGL